MLALSSQIKKKLLMGYAGILLLIALFSLTATIIAPRVEATVCSCDNDCNGLAPNNVCSIHVGCNVKQANKNGICGECPTIGSTNSCANGKICQKGPGGRNVCVLQTQTQPQPQPQPVNTLCSAGTSDIMLVIDGSNSMQGAKLAGAKSAANKFVNIVARNPQNRVGVAVFDNNGGLKAGLSRDYSNARQAINSISPPGTGDGGTCLECAIDKRGDGDVRSAFANAGGTNKKAVIILTDGRINRWMKEDGTIVGSTKPADEEQARNQALGAINGVRSTFHATFYVIQYGGVDNKAWLANDIVKPPGTYQGEANGESLEKMYADIADEIIGGTITAYTYNDVNKDGKVDAGEVAIANVMTQLSGVGSKATGADGKAVYANLCPGAYTLSATQPAAYSATPSGSLSRPLNLTLGGNLLENFGFVKEGAVTVTPPPNPDGAISFLFKLALHGIGVAGDNVLPRPAQCARSSSSNQNGCLSNQKPLHHERDLSVDILNALGESVSTLSGKLIYSSTSGTFDSTVKVESAMTEGPFTFKLHTPMFLQKKIVFSKPITAGETYELPLTDLTASDVDNDNVLTILDYNMIASCYTFPKFPNPCTPEEVAEVDNDDNGIVDEYNINLFTREISVQKGD